MLLYWRRRFDLLTENRSVLLIGNMAGKMGRGQSVCETLADLLQRAGWKVLIASGKIPWYSRLLDMLFITLRHRKSYSVALVEVFSGRAFIWAEIVTFALRLLKKPYGLALYGGNLPDFSKKNAGRVQRLLKRAGIVISPSEYTRQLMFTYRSDIRVLSYGVDYGAFRFRLRTRPEPALITVRAFHKLYNLVLAPKVLALVSEQFEDASLSMTGGDKHDGTWESVRDTFLRLHMSNRVKMLGFVPREDLPGLMDKADILLNTPNIDNTPVSLLEAMACGLCIVSTDVGGIHYLLKHENDALLVPPDDAPAMASAVRRILTEPGLAERLSSNARQKAEQFDWSVVLPKWEALFEELARK